MLIVLCGKSASGKDAVKGELIERGYVPLISSTTRPMRPGEKDGVDYNFRTDEEFQNLLAEGRLIEHRSYNVAQDGQPATWYYGLEASELDPDRDYVVVLDLDGAKSAIEKYGADATKPVILDAPDGLRRERAKARGGFNEAEWDRRLAADAEDFSEEKIAELSCIVPVRQIDVTGLSPEQVAETVVDATMFSLFDLDDGVDMEYE